MIKGVLNTYDHRFGDNINNFLKLVSFINIEYKLSKANKPIVVEFNGFKNIKLFKRSLDTIYRKSIEEIEETLLLYPKKYERVNLITNLISKFTDVQLMLVHDKSRGFKHENFKVSSDKKIIKKAFDESYCKSYYAEINRQLSNMLYFLDLRREDQKMLVDSEIPLHEIHVPLKHESTKEYPIRFFQYLATKKGASGLLEKFRPSSDDFSRLDISYDDSAKTITYNHLDVESGKYSYKKISFNEYLLKRTNLEVQISKQLIQDHFNSLASEAEASFFLKQTLSDLTFILKNVNKVKEFPISIDVKKSINALVTHVKTKYKSFIFPRKPYENQENFFQLKGVKALMHDKAVNLHNSLFKNKYIEKESKKDFIKLFTGKQTLNKIMWVGNKNELKLLINLLIKEHKIENCKSKKWLITASNFKFKDGDFSATQIKDVKTSKDKSKIENIVSKISS